MAGQAEYTYILNKMLAQNRQSERRQKVTAPPPPLILDIHNLINHKNPSIQFFYYAFRSLFYSYANSSLFKSF